MSNQKLADAAKAIERAYKASQCAVDYPHGYTTPCKTQLAAAKAEVECAIALIADWQRATAAS